jgi:hypothetical protein
MSRLPIPGSDDNTWGSVLNDFLSQSLSGDGSLQPTAITKAGGITQTSADARYVQSGSALADKGGQVFNVKTYGAIGNGANNDTTAVQATITAASSAGGIVYFPTGSYVITSSLNITTSGVSLIGAGAGATTLVAPAGSENLAMVVVGDGTNTCADVIIQDLMFSAVNLKTANSAIKLQKAFRTHIERIRTFNQYRGVHVYNSTETHLNNSDIRDTKENGVVFEATLGNGYDLYINNLTADNPTVLSGNIGSGIMWLGGENFVIQNCDVLHFQQGFNANPSVGQQTRFGFFTDAEFDTCYNNSIQISSGGGDIVGLTFTNSWTGTAVNYGVLIDSGSGGTTQGVRFIGHKSFHNGLAGIRMAGGEDLHLTGCDIVGNSQTVSGTRSGIEIASGIGTHWSVIGCKSGNGYQQGTTQAYGINFDAATYTNFIIANNELSDNISGAINLNSATGNPGKVFSNTGYDIEHIWAAGSTEIMLTDVGSGQSVSIRNDGNLHIDGGGNNVWVDGGNIYLDSTGGSVAVGTSSPNTSAGITVNKPLLIASKTTLTNGASTQSGTLTNAPLAGNPTKWIPIDDNGTTRYIPCW